jgi:hypothetical protein
MGNNHNEFDEMAEIRAARRWAIILTVVMALLIIALVAAHLWG